MSLFFSRPDSARQVSPPGLGFWFLYLVAFVLAALGIRGFALALQLVLPPEGALVLDAAVAVGVGGLFLRWHANRSRLANYTESASLAAAADPDFRRIVGDFSAASRESLDVSANTEAFLDAVAEALTPSYQLVIVRQPGGPLEPLGSRGLSDPVAHLKRGPSQDELTIPLKVGERTIGRLLLGPRVSGADYTSADFALLDSLGQSLALSLRNAQLFQELAGQERLKRELEIACEVQMGLLPKSFPRLPGASLAAQCVPALEVGGDFFDFVQIDATRWGVLVGDVSGKGVPAALMMAVSLTLFRALAPGIPSPASTLGRLNKLIHRNRPSKKIFVAAVYFIYDARDGSVLMANAGHPPPLMDGQPVPIKGLPLGINPRVVYKETKFVLPPGSSLAIYSDGLEDVEDEQGRAFGPERVSGALRRLARYEPEAALESLKSEVQAYVGRGTPPDDQTVAILRRNPPEAGDIKADARLKPADASPPMPSTADAPRVPDRLPPNDPGGPAA